MSYLRSDGIPVSLEVAKGTRHETSGADGCWPTDMAPKRILLDCLKGSDFSQLTASPKGGEAAEIPNDHVGTYFEEIGNYWVSGSNNDNDYTTVVYSNWRDGRVNFCGPGPGCSPSFDLNTSKARVHVKEPKFIRYRKLPGVNKACADEVVAKENIAVFNLGRLYVWKKNMKSPKAVGPRAKGCTAYGKRPGVEMGSGKITWVAGKRLWVVDTRTLSTRSVELGVEEASAVRLVDTK